MPPYDPNHAHAVRTANGTTYSYDANGNLTSATNGFTSTYTQFNQPLKMQKGSSYSQFEYGANEERVVETTEKGKTVYVGSVYEYTTISGTPEDHFYIMTPAGRTAVVVRKAGVESTTYFHQDHLGSIELQTDQVGHVLQRYSYDAWGAPRAANWATGLITPVHSVSARGFSDHEMLDGLGLIHMNGRIYDPVLGRFLRADPNVPHEYDSQSYNRYSYVDNNPLSLVDPTGYEGDPSTSPFNVDLSYSGSSSAGFEMDTGSGFATSLSYTSGISSIFSVGSSLSTTSLQSFSLWSVGDSSWNAGALNSIFSTGGSSITNGLAPNSGESLAWGVTKAALGGAGDYAKGLLWTGPKGLVTGLYNTVAHPINTATGIYNFGKAAVNDPRAVGMGVLRGVGNTLSNPEGLGTAAFGIVSALAPGAIAGKLAQTERVLVIGESMEARVIPYAQSIGAEIYPGMPGYTSALRAEALLDNGLYIERAKELGYRIIDYGPDFAKRELTGRAREAYELERFLTKDYPLYEKAFTR